MLTDLSSIPTKTGVYIFKNAKQRVIYIGKAKNLKNRVKSYFQKSSGLDPRKASMVKDIEDISYIVTSNELEAFVLEANLIKQSRPRFNIILRDDKNYPYLKLTVNEEWPHIEVVRKIRKDGALYFGPYVPAGAMWETLSFIRRNFRIRDCRFSLDKTMRPCIQHQMGRCLAPCAGYISRDEYLKLIEEIRLFLCGERRDLVNILERKMRKLSGEMRFEEAARIRDRIRAIEKAWESQKIITPDLGDIDVIGLHQERHEESFDILFIRNGIMIGSKEFLIQNTGDVPESELMYSFFLQFYSKEIIPPDHIIASSMPEGKRSVERWLKQRRGGAVRIAPPETEKERELVKMAQENALFIFRSRKEMNTEALLQEVRDKLGLKESPQDIGAFDVSNITGNEAVGAFVYWSGGSFLKDRYRKLKIRTVKGIDDYSMMEEIIERIILNLEGDVPDLLIIDGGKGHLETARTVVERNIPVLKKMPIIIAVAKDPDRAYLATTDEAVDLEDRSRSALLLKGIRDEVHRFAVGYHRKLRDKNLLRSPLERIPGIGKKRRLELLRVFGSIEKIREATVDEIAGLRGFHRKIAEEVLSNLRRNQ